MEFSLSKAREQNGKRPLVEGTIERPYINEQGEPEALIPAALTLEEVKPSFDEYLERVSLFEKSAEALEVKDDETREQAANLAAGAKKISKAVDARRKEVIAPAESFVKSVNAFCRKFTDRLSTAAGIAGRKELDYINLQEMKRREQERLALEATAKLQKQINKEAAKKHIEPIQVAAPVVPEMQTTARTESGVTSFTVKTWEVEVVSENEVPREFCSSDMRKLREAVKNGVRDVAGCRIYEKVEIRHRS